MVAADTATMGQVGITTIRIRSIMDTILGLIGSIRITRARFTTGIGLACAG
jgi:hypothetical protein